MVARTPPPKLNKMAVAPLNPVLIRETVKKVDRCMARLQELQYTVTGGTKVISGVTLSPRSTRGYLRTSLRCKQESLRIKNTTPRKSPVGKFPTNPGDVLSKAGEWKRMSLPAMLLGETLQEILQSSQFARDIVESISNKSSKLDDPKTPLTQQRKQRPQLEDAELKARRKKEKQNKLKTIRSESKSPPTLQRARSRINFKVVSPPSKREIADKENTRHLANRVSPKNRPWAKKTVLFPNPLFLSTPYDQQQKFCKTKSPVIGRNKKQQQSQKIQTPHKFLIKSPASASKFQVRIKSPPVISRSPPKRATSVSKKSPPKKMSTASKLRRSLSPSRLANRLVSPLKSRKNASIGKSDGLISGLKQRPTSSIPLGISARRV